MKSIILFFVVLGMLMITVGYHKQLLENVKTKTVIEYRYVPRSFYEEQLQPSNTHQMFEDMFTKDSVFFQTV